VSTERRLEGDEVRRPVARVASSSPSRRRVDNVAHSTFGDVRDSATANLSKSTWWFVAGRKNSSIWFVTDLTCCCAYVIDYGRPAQQMRTYFCPVVSSSSLIMAALSNRASHYIFVLWFLMVAYGIGQTIIFSSYGFFLSSIFFSSADLSDCTLDVYHTLVHGVALVQI